MTTPAYYARPSEKLLQPITSDGVFPDFVQFQAMVVNPFQVLVRWQIHPDQVHAYISTNYTFVLLRNDMEEESSFEEVTTELEGLDEYLDQPQSVQSRWRQIHYRLRVTHKPTLETKEIGPIKINEASSLSQTGRVIVQRLSLLLEKYPVGVLAFAFPQRQWGSRCTSCWNALRGMSDNSHCPHCFGTGWLYPYAEIPTRIFLAFSNTLEGVQWGDEETEPDDRNAWTVNIPHFKKRDLVYVPSMQRLFRVAGAQWMAQEYGLVGIKQGLRLTPVNMTDIEWKYFAGDRDLSMVRESMDILWNRAKKTYYGSRTNLPSLTPSTYQSP